MKNSNQVAFLAALLLGSLALVAPANAQRFYANDNMNHSWSGVNQNDRADLRVDHRFTDGRDMRDNRIGTQRDWRDNRMSNDVGMRGDWRFRNGNFISSQRLSAFNNNISFVRSQIADRLSRGRINPGQAARLNARLDNLMAMENNASASNGGISLTEFNQLNARLNSVRVGLMGGLRWY